MLYITAEYFGCEQQHKNKLIKNKPVNLALTETFNKKGENQIEFIFQNNLPITWTYINDAVRDLDYERILELAKENIKQSEELY